MSKYLFTSESVTEGHPDKLCDIISDSVLDALLCEDSMSRVACETFVMANKLNIMGEITTKAHLDYEKLAREVICNIGYSSDASCFNGNTCNINVMIHEQSSDIAMGVDNSLETRGGFNMDTGAGDQGMMFGYACNETPELMPITISLAHKLAKRLTDVRKQGLIPYLRPDGKTQVTFAFENGIPQFIDTIVVSAQHDESVDMLDLQHDIISNVITPVIPAEYMAKNTRILVNPTGRFCLGGPAADTGLTGRKIIVDTYGGYARHGGGAFSGKDPTKVDRSAAYMMRYIAKNIVASGLANKCELQVAYAIGVAHPVSVYIDTFGTGKLPNERLIEIVNDNFDLRPSAIIAKLGLRQPIYSGLAAYGHMGREDLNINYEKTDMIDTLKAYLK